MELHGNSAAVTLELAQEAAQLFSEQSPDNPPRVLHRSAQRELGSTGEFYRTADLEAPYESRTVLHALSHRAIFSDRSSVCATIAAGVGVPNWAGPRLGCALLASRW